MSIRVFFAIKNEWQQEFLKDWDEAQKFIKSHIDNPEFQIRTVEEHIGFDHLKGWYDKEHISIPFGGKEW